MIPMFHCMALLDGGVWKFQRLGMKASIFNQTFEEMVQLDLKGERVDRVEQCWGDLGRCLPAGCQDAFGLVSGHMIACLIGKEWSTSNEQTPGFFPIRLPIPKSQKTTYLWPNGVVSFRKAVSYLHIMYNIHDSHQTIQWYSLQDTPTWYVRRYESFQCTNSPPARTVATGWSFQTLFHQPARQSDCAWSAWGTLSYRTPFRMKNFSPWLRGRTKPARSGSPGFPSWQLLSLLQNLIVTLRFHCTKKKPSGRAGRYFCWLSLPISSHFPWTKFWSNWTGQESVREGPLCQRIDSRFFHTFGLASRVLPWWKKNLPWRMLAFFAGGSPFWVTSAPFWVSMAGKWPRNRNKPYRHRLFLFEFLYSMPQQDHRWIPTFRISRCIEANWMLV